MGVSRAVSLVLGTLAVSSGVVTLSFNIVFAATLPPSRNSQTHLTAIIASTFGCVSVVLLLLLFGRQIRYRNGAHIQHLHGRQHTYLLAGFGGIFGILSVATSAVVLGMMRNDMPNLSPKIIHSKTAAVLTAAFIIWAITLVSQAVFIVCMVIVQKRDFQQQIQPYRADVEQEAFPEMQESGPKNSDLNRGSVSQGNPSAVSPPSTGNRSRAGSEARSFRSSLSQVVRPMNSKTKLIQPSVKSPYRPQSVESNRQDLSTSAEDGFDSWDFSTVDPQSRKAVESISPTPQRFLPTIPASPTGSRSPSPGFPLDLDPPRTRKRSRSYSPAASQRERPKTPRVVSPTESTNEAHIHPLFRTDSPTPPPAASAATVVVAAVGWGQMMSDRESIRSIARNRAGSLPSTLLSHNPSLESIRRAMEREEWEKLDIGAIRKMTPPIPDFILNGGPRSSMYNYNARKKSQNGTTDSLGQASIA